MQKYIDTTLQLKKTWEQSLYCRFLKSCTQAEFLQSQIPFYSAVECFPRVLLQLASKIETSESRLKVIENIWEEHGQGRSDHFHTSTFMAHLESLNSNQPITLKQNPFVTTWTEDLLDDAHDIATLGTLLGAIEYMYAVISEDIAQTMSRFELANDTCHYKKHATLDWSHGQELLDVVTQCHFFIDDELFENAQRGFIALFNTLSFPTKVELADAAQLPISFYFSREDSHIGLEAIAMIEKNKVDIFSICSGGEHALQYLLLGDKRLNLTLSDINAHQLALFKQKLHQQDNTHDISGKFEYFFDFLRQLLGVQDGVDHQLICDHPVLFDFAMKQIFSRDNLNAVFTNKATRYSSEDFAEHFSRALLKDSKNTRNILFEEPIISSAQLAMIDPSHHDITYLHNDLLTYDFSQRYDIIDLSNIGDWMELPEYVRILDKAYQALNESGILIVRKLLGDYHLADLLSAYKRRISMHDNTGFYTETIMAIK
jgi:hypothetical protein